MEHEEGKTRTQSAEQPLWLLAASTAAAPPVPLAADFAFAFA
jgi:hypothetical protein